MENFCIILKIHGNCKGYAMEALLLSVAIPWVSGILGNRNGKRKAGTGTTVCDVVNLYTSLL